MIAQNELTIEMHGLEAITNTTGNCYNLLNHGTTTAKQESKISTDCRIKNQALRKLWLRLSAAVLSKGNLRSAADDDDDDDWMESSASDASAAVNNRP